MHLVHPTPFSCLTLRFTKFLRNRFIFILQLVICVHSIVFIYIEFMRILRNLFPFHFVQFLFNNSAVATESFCPLIKIHHHSHPTGYAARISEGACNSLTKETWRIAVRLSSLILESLRSWATFVGIDKRSTREVGWNGWMLVSICARGTWRMLRVISQNVNGEGESKLTIWAQVKMGEWPNQQRFTAWVTLEVHHVRNSPPPPKCTRKHLPPSTCSTLIVVAYWLGEVCTPSPLNHDFYLLI